MIRNEGGKRNVKKKKKKPQSTQLCLKNRGLEERIGSFGDLRAILIVWQHL